MKNELELIHLKPFGNPPFFSFFNDNEKYSRWLVLSVNRPDIAKWQEFNFYFFKEKFGNYCHEFECSHWVIGWINYLLVNPETPDSILAQMEGYLEGLEDYPIIDDFEYSEWAYEKSAEEWGNMNIDWKKHWIKTKSRQKLHYKTIERYTKAELWELPEYLKDSIYESLGYW
jgi:hypothetical protein